MREQYQRHQRKEDIEAEDRHHDGKGRIRVGEVRAPDSGKGQGVERNSQQEESIQVRCHAHVIAEVTDSGKAQLCGEKRTGIEQSRTLAQRTSCESPYFRGPDALKKFGGEKRGREKLGCPFLVAFSNNENSSPERKVRT